MFQVEFFTTASGRRPVHDFILDQDAPARDKIYEVMGYLKAFGFHLSTTYLRRMSGSRRLWELRTKSQSKQYRLFLARLGDERILLLHAFVKKTQKTPRREIETAEERLALYEKGGV